MPAPRNPRLDRLRDYPFRRLDRLLDAPPGREPAVMSIGEPQHPPPALLAETLARHAGAWGRYPPTAGTPELRGACADWLAARYRLPPGMVDPGRHVLPLAGTREGLFSAALAAMPGPRGGRAPRVLMPDPFYQVYRGAAVMAGAEPAFLPATRATGFLPDLDAVADGLGDAAVVYLCTPANPQGAVAGADYLAALLAMVRERGALLVVDECYAEIWCDRPPPGILEACRGAGGSLANVVAFHSLSKRSNAPGLRSGFCAGDPDFLAAFLRMRAYGGPQQPLPVQAAAAALWRDERHVEENRALYRAKFDAAGRILGGRFGFYRPGGGFFLWLDVGDGEEAARRLWRDAGVRVMPGAYLASDGHPDARRHIRVALVPGLRETRGALARLAETL